MTTKIGLADVLSVPNHVLLRRVGQEMVLLNLESDRYFALDDVAARFIEMLQPSGSIDAIALRLVEEYEVEFDVVANDLLSVSAALIDAGLLSTTQ